MEPEWTLTPSITLPQGWRAGAVVVGIKKYGDEPRYDVGILVSDRPCTVGGIFTQNQVCGAPVTVTRQRVQSGTAQALVVNSGCSNVAMGERGIRDAEAMAAHAARKLGLPEASVLVGSTGVIARPLPLDRVTAGIDAIELSREGGDLFSRAIMTTDTTKKIRAVHFEAGGKRYVLAGTAKGSGMVHPNMATVFCFLTTDAAVGTQALQEITARVGDQTINMVDVDMDTSTSDMMLAFANGAAGGAPLESVPGGLEAFERAMLWVCTALAKDLARDGEGARTMIEVEVRGALSTVQARQAARTIVSSPLIKTMVTGRDPNLGRVLMALGRSPARVEVERLSVWIGAHLAFERGTPTSLDLSTIKSEMNQETVKLAVDLGQGLGSATAWGCDLTEGYVRINGDYTT